MNYRTCGWFYELPQLAADIRSEGGLEGEFFPQDVLLGKLISPPFSR